MSAATPSPWHVTRQIGRNVWSICEPGHVNMWLVAGAEKAVLIDTGLGIAPLRPTVETLTDLPITVVNSHYHFDHVGGNHEFPETLIHHLGQELVTQPVSSDLLQEYAAHAELMIAGAAAIERGDHDFVHLIDVDSRPKPLPSGFDPTAWQIAPQAPSGTLDEGDTIDLGGRVLRVLHTPGHSGDSICIFDEDSGILFGGDTINTGPIYAQFHDSDLEAFVKSTARLAEIKDDVSMVAVNHFGRTIAPPYFLEEVREGFERTLDDDSLTVTEAQDCIGERVREYQFDRFAIFLAPSPESR